MTLLTTHFTYRPSDPGVARIPAASQTARSCHYWTGRSDRMSHMPNLNRLFRGPVAYLLLILVLVFLFFRCLLRQPQVEQARLSDVVKSISDGRVKDIVLEDQTRRSRATSPSGRKFQGRQRRTPSSRARTRCQLCARTSAPSQPSVDPAQASRCWSDPASNRCPLAVLLLLFFFLMQQMQGGGNRR